MIKRKAKRRSSELAELDRASREIGSAFQELEASLKRPAPADPHAAGPQHNASARPHPGRQPEPRSARRGDPRRPRQACAGN